MMERRKASGLLCASSASAAESNLGAAEAAAAGVALEMTARRRWALREAARTLAGPRANGVVTVVVLLLVLAAAPLSDLLCAAVVAAEPPRRASKLVFTDKVEAAAAVAAADVVVVLRVVLAVRVFGARTTRDSRWGLELRTRADLVLSLAICFSRCATRRSLSSSCKQTNKRVRSSGVGDMMPNEVEKIPQLWKCACKWVGSGKYDISAVITA